MIMKNGHHSFKFFAQHKNPFDTWGGIRYKWTWQDVFIRLLWSYEYMLVDSTSEPTHTKQNKTTRIRKDQSARIKLKAI